MGLAAAVGMVAERCITILHVSGTSNLQLTSVTLLPDQFRLSFSFLYVSCIFIVSTFSSLCFWSLLILTTISHLYWVHNIEFCNQYK